MSVVHVNSVTLWVCLVLLVFPKPYFCATTTARDVNEETTTVISTTTEVDSTTQQDTTTESETSTQESEDSTSATTAQTEEPDSGETLTTTSKTPTTTDSFQDIDGTTEPSVAENEINPRFGEEGPQNREAPSDGGYFYDPPNAAQGQFPSGEASASDSPDSGYFYEKPSIPFEVESVRSAPVEAFNGYDYPKPEKIFTYPWETPSNQIYTDYNEAGFGGYY